MKVLVIDIGGSHVKILATGRREKREFKSGPHLTPAEMVARVKPLARGWKFDAAMAASGGAYEWLAVHGYAGSRLPMTAAIVV